MATGKFEVGEIVGIGANVPSYERKHYNLIPGDEVTVTARVYQGYRIKTREGKETMLSTKYLVKLEPTSSIDKFNKLIEDAKSRIERTLHFIAETEAKIEFLKETGSEVFNENEFKAYHTLTIIEQSNMSKIEKAKAIASLIAGK